MLSYSTEERSRGKGTQLRPFPVLRQTGVQISSYGTMFVTLLLLVLSACVTHDDSAPDRGEVQYVVNGKIGGGTGVLRCETPRKSYAQDIVAALNGELASIDLTVDAEYRNKITRLTDYSQSGLDLDLLLFRICEISINRGLTNDQTTGLLTRAVEIWTGRTLTPGSEVNPTDPFDIFIACEVEESVLVDTFSFPWADIAGVDRHDDFVNKILNQLPMSCDISKALIFRVLDERVVQENGNVTITEGGNTGVLVLPEEILESYSDHHLAFTHIKSFVHNNRDN